MNLRLFGIAVVLVCQGIAFAVSEQPDPLELTGSVQVQGQKALWDNNADVNLDEFWGRANFGAVYTSQNMSSALNVRAFPEGWGFEPLTGLTVKEDSVVGVTKTQIARFIIEQAWVKYRLGSLFLRVGRFYTTTSKTLTLGNFTDQNPAGSFLGKVAYHNALDGALGTGPVTTSVLLGAGDKNLNTGYLRIESNASLLEKKLHVGAGYRVNIFDRVHDGEAELYNRFALVADYKIAQGLCPYIEIGILDNKGSVIQKNSEDEYVVPLLVGTSIPAGKIFNSMNMELEFLSDRVIGIADVPVMWNIYFDKKVASYARFQFGFSSDPAGEADDVRFALRYTGSLR